MWDSINFWTEALCLVTIGSKESFKSRDFTGKGTVVGGLLGNP